MAEHKAGLISVGLLSALVGTGYGAAKWLAASDRRRTGVDRDRLSRAMEYLTEPEGTKHHRFASHDGGQLHAVEFGPTDAHPIVLLHGVTLAATLYNHALVDLGDRFRVIALDWRGHGRSRPGRDGYGLGPLGRDVATLLDHLDLTNAVVLGHSMGGMGLGHFAVNHPNICAARVSGLVFCDTAAFAVGVHGSRTLRRLLSTFGQRNPELAGKIAQAPSGDIAYLGARVNFGKNPDPVSVEQTRLMFDAMTPSAITNSILPLFAHDLRASLPSVTTPSLVMVGSDDPLTPPSQADDLVRLLPNSRLHTFPDVGHLPMLECRTDFAEVLAAFATEVQPPR
jgi:pimeloyl-ACP methyl ester carboxylesterase